MQKILLLTHEFAPFHGGIGTYANQLARAVHRLGHTVTVVAPDFGSDARTTDPTNFPYRIIRFAAGTYWVRDLLTMVPRLLRIFGTDRHDIIHAVDWPHVVGLSLINRFKTVPFLATAFGTEILGVVGSRQVRLLLGGKLFRAPRHILAISEFTRSLLLERCPDVSADKVHVTPLGVGEEFFVKPRRTAEVKAKYGVPENCRVILTVARLDDRKGHRTVLAGLAALPERLKEGVAYVIAGRGEDESYLARLRAEAAACGVPVVFAGAVAEEDLVELYAAADLFCMPGESHPDKVEGFGLVYLEAAAQGVPSIASRVGAVPEVVIDGETGLLVSPRDGPALSEALATLLTDEARLNELGANARRLARRRTWERCARKSYDI